MDFINRSNQHGHAAGSSPNAAAAGHRSNRSRSPGFLQLFSGLLILGVALLLVAVALGVVFTKGARHEEELVDSSKYQVVVIGSQSLVYYGHITHINKDYLTLSDIWYVTPQQTAQTQATNANYNLVKQGCELHGPTDPMVVRRDTVIFWQNLKTDSKVSKGITDTKAKYPDGAKDCYAAAGASTDTKKQ